MRGLRAEDATMDLDRSGLAMFAMSCSVSVSVST